MHMHTTVSSRLCRLIHSFHKYPYQVMAQKIIRCRVHRLRRRSCSSGRRTARLDINTQRCSPTFLSLLRLLHPRRRLLP